MERLFQSTLSFLLGKTFFLLPFLPFFLEIFVDRVDVHEHRTVHYAGYVS